MTPQNAGRWRQKPKGRCAPVRCRRQSRALLPPGPRSVPGRARAGAALTIAPPPPGTAATAPPPASAASLRAAARDKRAGGAERGASGCTGAVPAAGGGGRCGPAVRCEGGGDREGPGGEREISVPCVECYRLFFPRPDPSFHLLYQLVTIKTFLCVL